MLKNFIFCIGIITFFIIATYFLPICITIKMPTHHSIPVFVESSVSIDGGSLSVHIDP